MARTTPNLSSIRRSTNVTRTLAVATVLGALIASVPVGSVDAQTTTTTTTQVVPFVSAPQAVQAQKVRDNEIRVSWLPPQSANQPVQSYQVQIQSNSADAIPSPNVVSVNGNTTSVNFRNLKMDRSYFFTVQARTSNALSEVSAASNIVDLPNPANLRPNPVSNVTASPASPTQAIVNWNPPAAKTGVTIKGFRITTAPSSKRSDVGLAGTALIDGLKPGVAYIIQVQAISTTNALSDVSASGVVLMPPPVTAAPVTLAPTTVATTTSTTTTTLLPLPSPVEVPTLKPASRCTTRAWGPTLLGVPRQLAAGATPGVYIWTDGRAIQVRVYNSTTTPIRISGSVSSKTSLPVVGFYLEKGADTLSIGRSSSSFSFVSAYDIDSLRFDGRCATKVTFRLLVNGQPIPPSQVFIGGDGIHPTTSDFVLSR